jgi:hypothetical protein
MLVAYLLRSSSLVHPPSLPPLISSATPQTASLLSPDLSVAREPLSTWLQFDSSMSPGTASRKPHHHPRDSSAQHTMSHGVFQVTMEVGLAAQAAASGKARSHTPPRWISTPHSALSPPGTSSSSASKHLDAPGACISLD